ncbi:MAG: hypothetical protein JNK87_30125 [Bryobacterales bacterium]|nr:hypothetical protein [Bryobacterales bacterium]
MARVLFAVLFVLALLPSAWLAWTNRDMPHFGHHHDDAMYFVSAQSLAVGGGYRIMSLPGEPPNSKYPPGYPLYLSLAWRLNPNFPQNLSWVLLLCWLMLPAAILACRWVYPERPWLWFLLGLSPPAVFLSLSAMTEVPALCFVLLTVGLARGERVRRAAFAGLAAAAGFCVKNALLMLLPAAVLWYLLQRRPRHAAAFTAAMLPAVIAWQMWSSRHVTLGAIEMIFYTHYTIFWLRSVTWDGLPAMVSQNLSALLAGIGSLFSLEPEYTLFAQGRSMILAFAAIAGCVRLQLRQGLSLYALFAGFYSIQLLLWNFSPNERLLFPLFPFLLTGLVATCGDVYNAFLRSKMKDPVGSRVILALGVLLLANAMVRNVYGVVHYIPQTMAADRARLGELRQVWSWIRENTPETARLNPPNDDPLTYLYTRRKAVARQPPTQYLYSGNRAGLLDWFSNLPEVPVDYVLAGQTLCQHNLSPDDRKEITARLVKRPDLALIHEFKDWKVLRVQPAAPANASAARLY